MAAVQTKLEFPPTWGGKRPGAGRKPNGRKAGVSHLARPEIKARHPVHVTVRMRPEVWNLRTQRCMVPIQNALEASAQAAEFHVVYASVQGNHIHFIIEVASKHSLSLGMQRLCIRIAKGINAVMGREKGRVFADRYHAHVLKTPTEVANALMYVLGNRQVHLARYNRPVRVGWRDPYTTSPDAPFTEPKTWLLSKGWRRVFLI